MVVNTDIREHVDDNDPGSVNLSLKGGKAKMSFWWASTNVNDFANLATMVLGSSNRSGTGGIARTLPMAHPRFPTLYAETISDFPGLGGKFIKENSAVAAPAGGSPPPQYARYPQYRVDVEFATRLYNLATDATPTAQSFQDDQGTGADVTVKYWDAVEYTRWVWTTSGPKENLLTAKSGAPGYMDVGGGFNTPQMFADFIKLPMPDGAVKLTWYEVPYSFVTSSSSFFRKYQGRVNYSNFLNWTPGQLLYVTIQPRPYMQPFLLPTVGGGGITGLIPLCDIDIIMLETSRVIGPNDPDVPAPAPGGRLSNWIAAGWNLMPWWRDKFFHYTHQGKSAGIWTTPLSQQVPMFRSVPFQIFFSDPDVAPPP